MKLMQHTGCCKQSAFDLRAWSTLERQLWPSKSHGAVNLVMLLATLCSSSVRQAWGLLASMWAVHATAGLFVRRCRRKAAVAWWRRPSLPYTEVLGYDRSCSCCSQTSQIARLQL